MGIATDLVPASYAVGWNNGTRRRNRDICGGMTFDIHDAEGIDHSHANFPLIVAPLIERGYKEEDVAKIIGGNWLRVYEAAWGIWSCVRVECGATAADTVSWAPVRDTSAQLHGYRRKNPGRSRLRSVCGTESISSALCRTGGQVYGTGLIDDGNPPNRFAGQHPAVDPFACACLTSMVNANRPGASAEDGKRMAEWVSMVAEMAGRHSPRSS